MYVLGGIDRSSATFTSVADEIKALIKNAPVVKTERWQGVKANQDTHELRNVVFEIPLRFREDLDHWRRDIVPNLPWADDHFLERVGGHPINPGEQWKHWPFATGTQNFQDQKRFNHNYMERLWPRYARRTDDGKLPVQPKGSLRAYPGKDNRPHYGIGHYYGDLQDLVELLVKEPMTRQAYIPLWFPEDTGLGDNGRKPCTLGYQFLVRDERLHMWYPLRSCDFVHHWRDDCYLAVRLLLWVLRQCRAKNPSYWDKIKPGSFSMHCTSLHVFATHLDKLK